MILLFDLDGTLTDPRDGIVGSTRYAFERLGRTPPADDVLASFIGPPLRGMFHTLLGPGSQALVEQAVLFYRERYQDIGIYETRMYEGIPAMLERVRPLASRIYLATSKPWMFAERVLGHLGIDEHFDRVYGPDLNGQRDDKAELIAHMVVEEAIEADDAVMVGDRAVDVIAATTNGMKPVGVLWGYGSTEELRGAGACRLCATPERLVDEVGALRDVLPA